MKERLFRFKQFSVSHSKSAMKVGMDGVLLGCWADICGDKLILDVGCGCGIISLICAQRNKSALIEGIDIDEPSIIESNENFSNSPWPNRLHAIHDDFISTSIGTAKYSHIISNPPFFKSGIKEIHNSRLRTRHADNLSPLSLIYYGSRRLQENGKISLICPDEWLAEIEDLCSSLNLAVGRICKVKSFPHSKCMRLLLEIHSAPPKDRQTTELIIYESEGLYTQEYKTLTKDFYLNF